MVFMKSSASVNESTTDSNSAWSALDCTCWNDHWRGACKSARPLASSERIWLRVAAEWKYAWSKRSGSGIRPLAGSGLKALMLSPRNEMISCLEVSPVTGSTFAMISVGFERGLAY